MFDVRREVTFGQGACRTPMSPIVLRDDSAGTSAKLLPERGFNCFSFQALHDGHPTEVLWSAEEFENGEGRPSRSGIPILFPFPGRMRGTRFSYDGRTFELEDGDRLGNAIHGFVLNRPWEVIHRTPQSAVGWFQASRVEPALLDRWPSDFRLMVSYELRGNALHSELVVENPGDRPLPWGLGTHPYFRVPLVPGGDANACRITVPVRQYWELHGMLPTGKLLPVDSRRNLAGTLSFAETQLDDVFVASAPAGRKWSSSIHDPRAACTLALEFDAAFETCVVFTPPHREAICIEPYTCAPGRFGQGDAWPLEKALRLLPPGESVRLSAKIELRSGTS
jgi:aldose 1-epimerase